MICIRKHLLRSGATVLTASLLLSLVAVGPQAAADEQTSSGRMMLVLDASGSMAEEAAGGTTKIEAARESLRAVTDALPEDQPVGLRVFGAEVFSADDPGACTDSQQVVAPGTGNRDELREAVEAYEPYGETPTGFALQEAGKDLGGEGQRTIILVSDGEPTCEPDPCEVAGQLSQDGIDLRIDVVGLNVSGEARKSLQCIAEQGNGTYYDADDADSLTDSLTRVSERSSRPFDLTGEPVEGAASPEQGPQLGSGIYLDTIPSTGELWYRVPRTVPGSTLHVGAAFQYVSSNNNVYLKVFDDPTGAACASVQVHRMLSWGRPLVNQAASTWSDDPEDGCNTADTVYVQLESSDEDIAGRPLQLVVYEEPPLADPSQRDLPPRPDDPAWTTLEPADDPVDRVVPGTSMASAPVVEDGSYALDINTEETQVLAVPLDWGQDLQVQLDAVWPEDAWQVEIRVISPMRGRGNVDFFAEEPGDWTTTALPNLRAGEPVRLGAQTLTTAFRHRSGGAEEAGAALPGLRYVEVSFRGDREDVAVNLPYTLTLQTNGTAGEGAPTYAEGAGLVPPSADFAITAGNRPDQAGAGEGADASPSPAPSSEPDGEPSTPAAAPVEDDPASAGPPVLALALGGAGLALLVAAVVLLVVRLRR
ncbi:vWA domain-containing protein [Desertihabitans aurantiacus]|uniref:vWA domain-containing protein n=1 Tax=Desertihabitans aurantiacus TaxID=2282477 RepID=UPI000DF730E3|nr:VWA domain-containing protein [Desertihabitans aurantiacus]